MVYWDMHNGLEPFRDMHNSVHCKLVTCIETVKTAVKIKHGLMPSDFQIVVPILSLGCVIETKYVKITFLGFQKCKLSW